jgi:hypothetical protein
MHTLGYRRVLHKTIHKTSSDSLDIADHPFSSRRVGLRAKDALPPGSLRRCGLLNSGPDPGLGLYPPWLLLPEAATNN